VAAAVLRLHADLVLVAGGIRIDAISGVGLDSACECSGAPASAVPITSINGVGTDDGDFEILGGGPGNCVQVATTAGQVSVTDSCSAPCCGCAEREKLQAALDWIRGELGTLQGFLQRLDASVANQAGVITASKVQDTGCVTCG
jgi:hypothetical protein